MPSSKGKKKITSRVTSDSSSILSNCASSPRTPFSHASAGKFPSGGESAGEDIVQKALYRASVAFPGLISDSAFIGKVLEAVESPANGGRAKVWISQETMVSLSMKPGNLVTVSLPASDERLINQNPLHLLSEDYTGEFVKDFGNDVVSNVGRFFAIAAVFPSQKVIKHGLKISWSLFCTLGFPSIGRAVFVCPFKNSVIDKNLNLDVSTCFVKELHVTPISRKAESTTKLAKRLSVCSSDDNISLNSPIQTKDSISSLHSTPDKLSNSSDVVSNMDSWNCLDASFFKSIVSDVTSYELLQKCIVRWLHGRLLLRGNLVAIPIFGNVCFFLVSDLDDSVDGCPIQDLTPYKEYNSFSNEKELSNSLDYVNIARFVDVKTKIHIVDPVLLGEDSKDACLSVDLVHENLRKTPKVPRLGGLSKEILTLNEIIQFSFTNSDFLPRYKGVLLFGPPGTGKTSLASYCAQINDARFFPVNGPEIISQYYGESEQALRDVFESARLAAPSVIFIDELDAVAPTRESSREELSHRMVAALLKLMDEIGETDRMLVIAATNRPDNVDPALRRRGRLDREIEIGVPSPEQRMDILSTILGEIDHSLSHEEIYSLALATHGFVAADLAALCNEAAMSALRRYIKCEKLIHRSEKPNDRVVNEAEDNFFRDQEMASTVQFLEELSISSDPCTPACSVEYMLKVAIEDFETAKMKIRPSAMREVMLEVPRVSWEDVGGQVKVKQQLIEAVLWPQLHPDPFKRIGIRPPRGLLMIGPPGCSKTLMARAVASKAKLNFLAVKGPELFCKWVGESEKAVKSLFAKARANAPAIIFFDEIDGLAVTRGHDSDGTSVADRVLSQLLAEMDGLNQNTGVTVIAATNRPDKIDHALLRPGRFDRVLDVQPPDEADREDIFQIHTKTIPCSSDVCLKDLARYTEGYTGADIKLACREAALAALEESLDASEVSMAHFRIGIERVQPSDILFYEQLAVQFRRLVDSGSKGDC